MSDIGLMFNSEMIKAFLREQDPKTMTRRTRGLEKINENPDDWVFRGWVSNSPLWQFKNIRDYTLDVKCPYAVGAKVWARETWAVDKHWDNHKPSEINKGVKAWYTASGAKALWVGKTRSSMFMPKWAARIWQEIVAIRCERVQDITEEDAKSEGVTMIFGNMDRPSCRWYFKSLWDRLNGKKHPWSKNEWVWVLSLKEVGK